MTTYLSAFVDVRIKKNGRFFDRNNFPAFFNSIQSVKAEIKLDEISLMEITLSPSYQDAMAILRSGLLGIGLSSPTALPETGSKFKQSKPISNGGSSVDNSVSTPKDDAVFSNAMNGFAEMFIQFSRPNDGVKTPWYSGPITQPDFSISGSEVTITLKGYAYSLFLAGPQWIITVQEGSTALDVLEEVAEAIDHEIVYFDKDTETEDRLGKTKLIAQVRPAETPFQTIKWLLNEAGCSLIVGYGTQEDQDSRKIYVRKLTQMLKDNPIYTFVQWANINPVSTPQEVPLLNLSFDSARALFIKGFAFGTYRIGMDADTKEYIADVIEAEDQKETSRVKQTQMKVELGQKLPGWIQPVHTANPEQDHSTEARTQVQKTLTNFQMVHMEVPGLPNIAPTKMVNLKIGDVNELTGQVLITRVSHTCDFEGWTTTIDGRITGGLLSGDIKDEKGFQSTSSSNGKQITPSLIP